MVRPLNKKGNALVDLIIAMIILGLVSISVVGAYTSLMSIASNSFRNSQASWFGNSVMEIYSAKAFDDIVENNNFTLNDQFPGYTADITVEPKNVDLSTSTFAAGDGNSKYKEITVTAYNNVSNNSFTLKTIISAGVEEGGGADYTFTNCGQEGRTGPTQEQCNNEYGEGVVTVVATWCTTHLVNVKGIQEWTVPQTGAYRIEARGAQGGIAGDYNGGKGASIKGDFNLTEGETIKILVGQQGIAGANNNNFTTYGAAGGGGGTFVVKTPFNNTSSILVIAGGGGGPSSSLKGKFHGEPGLTGISGGDSGTSYREIYSIGGSGSGCRGPATGGSNGHGGEEGCGAGGGGFLGNGDDGGHLTYGGKALINGGGGCVTYITPRPAGGFGGGGNGSPGWGYGGGGGGYSGGGGGPWKGNIRRYANGPWGVSGNGGGGGSYCGDQEDGECVENENATGEGNEWELNEGHGKVIVTTVIE